MRNQAKMYGLLFIGIGLWCYPNAAWVAQTQPDTDAWLRVVEDLVDTGDVVGIEVLLQRNGAVWVHEAFGWNDRAAGERLEVGTIYNIRSMTKPMAGMVTHRLVEKGVVTFEDRVAQYLPLFNQERTRALTLEHLLTHRGGYEQGQPGKPWTQYKTLRAMADYWGKQGPTLPSDGRWSYADAHADILGAALEVATQQSARQLLEAEVFAPLQLNHTFVDMSPRHPRHSQIATTYRGQTGDWRQRWSPEDGAFYPFGMFAQSVFSTAQDYARLMRMWMQCGELDGNVIMPCASVKRAFQQRDPVPVPPGYFSIATGRIITYSHMWAAIYESDASDADLPFAFLHQGSDGTAAYAFPDLDLIAIVLTQSRGTTALPTLEQALLTHIVEPLKMTRGRP